VERKRLLAASPKLAVVDPYPISHIAALGAVLGGALVGGLVYARYIEPYWVTVERVSLILPRLAPAFDGYRIVQISDLHLDGWMTPERLERIIDLVNEQEPDLVAITGDFVSSSSDYLSGLPKPLGRLQARDGKVAVLGNHDHLNDATAVRRAISAAGIVDVSNDIHTLHRGGVALHLCGVDCVMDGYDRLDEVLDHLDNAEPGCAILLAHEPDFADESAATRRFDLQLSGHSHGGQVRLPFLGCPFFLPPLSFLLSTRTPPLARKYQSGYYKVEKMHQYTNRGLGVMYAPFRLNCRPEITVFTLQSP
jgi:predicted MPP superfamily phosphohydrolase